jgi:hypothetical protein
LVLIFRWRAAEPVADFLFLFLFPFVPARGEEDEEKEEEEERSGARIRTGRAARD